MSPEPKTPKDPELAATAPLSPDQAPDQAPESNNLLNVAWIESLKAIHAAPNTALAWAKQATDLLPSMMGSLRLFSSTQVDAAKGNPAQDETHYFLVPTNDGYVLAERRRLPDGVGTVNSLPKVRIFHVHDLAGVTVLEEQLLGKLSAAQRQQPGWDADLAKRLETIGEEIDQQSFWVTGGLAVIGGAVAMANPLLGIGIAAKALLPGLVSKITKMGLHTVADSVRSLGDSWRDRSARNKAESEIKRLKPQIVVDPVLQFMDRQVAIGAPAEPDMSELEHLPDWWRDRDQRLTMSIVSDVLHEGCPWPTWMISVRRRLDVTCGQ